MFGTSSRFRFSDVDGRSFLQGSEVAFSTVIGEIVPLVLFGLDLVRSGVTYCLGVRS